MVPLILFLSFSHMQLACCSWVFSSIAVASSFDTLTFIWNPPQPRMGMFHCHVDFSVSAYLIFSDFLWICPWTSFFSICSATKKSYLVWRQSYHSKLKVPGLLSVVGKLSQSQKLTSWSHHQSFSSLIGNRGVCPTRFHIIFHSPSLYTCTWKWMLQYT